MSNTEAKAFMRSLRRTLTALQDIEGPEALLDATRRYSKTRDQVIEADVEPLDGVMCAPSRGFILDESGALDAWRN